MLSQVLKWCTKIAASNWQVRIEHFVRAVFVAARRMSDRKCYQLGHDLKGD